MNATFWLTIGVLGLTPGALLADNFSSLEESMTLDEFKQAGLEQLSEHQLRFLNRWLEQHGDLPAAPARPAAAAQPARPAQPAAVRAAPQPAAPIQAQAPTAAPAQPQDRTGFAPRSSDRHEIHSRIDGEFNGWRGKTRFKLANGQVWQQVGSGDFAHHAVDPNVVIKPKSLGSWKLYIAGSNRGVKVKRIK